jgi:23S rRNA (guanine745-N1)-methyltransferase
MRCDKGHNFDIARQGYVNLLSAQDKRSKNPGDSKAMVAARRDFLDAGYYQPLADSVSALLETQLDQQSLLVDAGCGEGYYLRQLARHLELQHKPLPALIGFDISKWAVQAAARAQSATWLVASNRQLPLADNTADVVLSLFGFPGYASFHRLLKPAGQLLLVEAGPRHLLELRKVIYPSIKISEPPSQHMAEQAGFVQYSCEPLTFSTAELDAKAVAQLLQMTPHLFRATRDGKQRAAELQHLALTVDVVISVWGKR